MICEIEGRVLRGMGAGGGAVCELDGYAICSAGGGAVLRD